jgi:hypothetical protein
VDDKATRGKGVDYTAASASTPATLKAHGVKVVVRYVGYQSGIYSWKNLRKWEANALRKNGIDIVSVYETDTSWMKGGYHAGVQAAKIAKADIIANGGPKDPFVYFACDEDAGYTGAVNAALRGAQHELGGDKVGIYGSYKVVDSALKTRSAAKGWQTMAWSQGKVAKGIALYQLIKPSAGNLGLDYDSNIPKTDDIGQWGRHTVTTGSDVKPKTTPAAKPATATAAGTQTAATTGTPASAPRMVSQAAPQAAPKRASRVATAAAQPRSIAGSRVSSPCQAGVF